MNRAQHKAAVAAQLLDLALHAGLHFGGAAVWQQVLLGLIHRKLVLRRGELLTIYIMMVVATSFSGGERNGFTLMMLWSTAGLTYLASPENEWVFLAWLIKTVVLKYGGLRAYLALQPLFYGLDLGQFVAGGLWLIIDYFTGAMGNRLGMAY